MRNTKYQSISVGRSGTGKIDLSKGSLCFIHEDIKPNSNILPVGVSHVYLSEEASSNDKTFGKGFKLNLQQKLVKKFSDQPTNTEFVYYDSEDNALEFEEVYYYIGAYDEKLYESPGPNSYTLTRANISIDFEGKLTFIENPNDPENSQIKHEVFAEIRTKSGLSLQTDFTGFKGSEKIETRHEEIVKVEEEITNLERSIADIKYSFHELKKSEQETSAKQIILDSLNTSESLYLDLPIESIVSLDISSLSIDEKQEYFKCLKERYQKLIKKENELLRRVSVPPQTDMTTWNTTNIEYSIVDGSGFAFDDYDGRMIDSISTEIQFRNAELIPIEEGEQKNRTKAMLVFQERFNAKCNMLKQKIDDLSVVLEQEHYTDLKERYESDLKSAQKMLDYKKYCLSKLIKQMPHYYIFDKSGIVLGFNQEIIDANQSVGGELVAIFDSYGNQTLIIYEDNKITKLINSNEHEVVFDYSKDGQLKSITDNLNNKTCFEYTDECLTQIRYPNGDCSVFEYDTNGLLTSIVSPAKSGIDLHYQTIYESTRVSKIEAISFVSNITSVGLLLNQNQNNEIIKSVINELDIIYPTLNTAEVSEEKTQTTMHYSFNTIGELIFENTTQNNILKKITTYDFHDNHERSTFIMEQDKFNVNFMDNSQLNSGNYSIDSEGRYVVNGEGLGSSVSWTVPISCLNNFTSDYLLYGFSIADSLEAQEIRKTAYGTKQNTSENPTYFSTYRLSAIANYDGGSFDEFFSYFDWRNKNRQMTALPVTLREDEEGKPILPTSLIVRVLYTFNNGNAIFEKPSLVTGRWVYCEYDDEHNKTAEYFGESVSDKTENGDLVGKYVVRAEKQFDYSKNLLIKETLKTIKEDFNISGLDLNLVARTEKENITCYEYNKQNKLIRANDSNGMISETSYDDKGNVLKTIEYHISNPSEKFYQEKKVGEIGQTLAELDECGENIVNYNYINGTSIITSVTDTDGQTTEFGLDSHTNDVVAISSIVGGEKNSSVFQYTKGFLTAMHAGNSNFNYEYDGRGRKTAIYVDDTLYVSFDYQEDEQTLNQILLATYASDEQIELISDKFGNLLAQNKIVNGIKYPYILNEYDNDFRLIKTTDYLSNEIKLFTYNLDGGIAKVISSQVASLYDTDVNGHIKKVNHAIDGSQQTYLYNYDEEGKLQTVTLPNGDSASCEYDNLGRIKALNSQLVKDQIYYYQKGDHATNLVSSIYQQIGTQVNRRKYTYDSKGNITQVYENGLLLVRYKYDGLNRIIREDNAMLNNSFSYEYDHNGNILYKNIYPFSLNDLTGGSVISYNYERDRLQSFNDEMFEYDSLGNPTLYRNKMLQWNNLKNLANMDGVAFEYNASGLRTKKLEGDIETKFFWADNRLLAEKRTIGIGALEPDEYLYEGEIYYTYTDKTDISYLYNANELSSFTIDRLGIEQTYYYCRNLQGDITRIYDASGVLKAEYAYDAWGNYQILVNEDNIANINPFRYRGYYYDNETGLYYLMSRYYDPETGRFINMDEIAYIAPNTINGLNLYAYCNNNPVMRIDPNGTSWISETWQRLLAGTGMILGLLLSGFKLEAAAVGATIGGNLGSTVDNAIDDIGKGVLTIGATSISSGLAGLFGGLPGILYAGSTVFGELSTRFWNNETWQNNIGSTAIIYRDVATNWVWNDAWKWASEDKLINSIITFGGVALMLVSPTPVTKVLGATSTVLGALLYFRTLFK